MGVPNSRKSSSPAAGMGRNAVQGGLFDNCSPVEIAAEYAPDAQVVLYRGDCLDLLRTIPDEAAQLVVTSPPYNIGKEYETTLDIDTYVSQQRRVITECVRILAPRGSICWQVGNYVSRGAIIPLDVLLYLDFCKLGSRGPVYSQERIRVRAICGEDRLPYLPELAKPSPLTPLPEGEVTSLQNSSCIPCLPRPASACATASSGISNTACTVRGGFPAAMRRSSGSRKGTSTSLTSIP